MENLTSWEKANLSAGTPIITWDPKAIADFLLASYRRDYAGLLLQAATDTSRRRNLEFVLNYHDLGGTNFGGTVNYNKKRRAFTFIQYSDRRNYAVRFSIAAPGICCPYNPRFWHYTPAA